MCNLIIECTHRYTCIWTSLECDFASSQPLESFMVWDNEGKSVETRFYCVKIKCKLHRDSKNANMLRSFGPGCALWLLRKRTCSRPAGRLSQKWGQIKLYLLFWRKPAWTFFPGLQVLLKTCISSNLALWKRIRFVNVFLKMSPGGSCLPYSVRTGLQAWAPTPG